MSKIELTGSEVIDSLTGTEEAEIEQYMGYDVYTTDEPEYGVFGRSKPVLLMRSLVFALERRSGKDPAAAKAAVMEMPASEVKGYFAEEPDEVDDDAPETEAGKDKPAPESAPESSPASA